jgi:hypothetical protein
VGDLEFSNLFIECFEGRVSTLQPKNDLEMRAMLCWNVREVATIRVAIDEVEAESRERPISKRTKSLSAGILFFMRISSSKKDGNLVLVRLFSIESTYRR